MRAAQLLALTFAAAATSAAARDLPLSLPIDCTLGDDSIFARGGRDDVQRYLNMDSTNENP